MKFCSILPVLTYCLD